MPISTNYASWRLLSSLPLIVEFALNFCLIHYKKQIFEELGGGTDCLNKIIDELLKYYPNVVLINDIEPSNKVGIRSQLYNSKTNELEETIKFIKRKFKLKSPKILYGGSVNPQNIDDLKKIKSLDGFLIGGASQSSKKFIDIVKKTYN